MTNILQGDCEELLKTIEDCSIDLTVTSPPYDNLRTYEESMTEWTEDKFCNIAQELYRVTAQGGVLVWIVGDATIDGSETCTSFKQAIHFVDCGFKLHDTMIYEKAGCALPSPNRYLQHFEYMFVFSKGSPKTYNLICDRPNRFERWGKTKKVREKDGSFSQRETKPFTEYGRRFNIWRYVTGGQGNSSYDTSAHEHPAVFPEALARDHIISWSNKGDLVLDPFMGSGTTGVVCKELGRDFIGIDIEKRYVDLAKKRIAQTVKPLF